VGVGSAINQLNSEVAMIAAVRGLLKHWQVVAIFALSSESTEEWGK